MRDKLKLISLKNISLQNLLGGNGKRGVSTLKGIGGFFEKSGNLGHVPLNSYLYDEQLSSTTGTTAFNNEEGGLTSRTLAPRPKQRNRSDFTG